MLKLTVCSQFIQEQVPRRLAIEKNKKKKTKRISYSSSSVNCERSIENSS